MKILLICIFFILAFLGQAWLAHKNWGPGSDFHRELQKAMKEAGAADE